MLLFAATLQDISGLNSDESEKNKRVQELKKLNKFDSWIIEVIENLLHYQEDLRWDFIVLYKFLQNSNKMDLSQKSIVDSPSL